MFTPWCEPPYAVDAAGMLRTRNTNVVTGPLPAVAPPARARGSRSAWCVVLSRHSRQHIEAIDLGAEPGAAAARDVAGLRNLHAAPPFGGDHRL